MAVRPGQLQWGAASDPGLVRKNNEDAYRILEEQHLFAVADGMGGHQGGAVAAALALEALRPGDFNPSDPGASLRRMVETAHRRVLAESMSRSDVRGMGTTLTVAHLGPEVVTVAHVGDSRAYMVRDGQALQLTRDHSVVEALVSNGQLDRAAARFHPQRHVLTQAVGIPGDVEVDVSQHPWRTGDRFLLCTDGLTEVVSDGELAALIAAAPTPQEGADALIDAARAGGAPDNVTVVLVHLHAEAVSPAVP